ncbi:hypothetical protein [Foetidibacter luteolus]|uniref:hypothetical protein n=1 Tax=Foetidibacter luteolus TaxID=2608880 RepID=UPI00129AFEFB|nr:hypothetical protein [Foetidibacter luteolus]
MAKAGTRTKKYDKINLENLSKKDLDHLTLKPQDVMKKYKLDKQSVYARRFALNKKISSAGVTVEQLTGQAAAPAAVEAEAPVKAKRGPKKGRPRKVKAAKPEAEKPAAPVVEVAPTTGRELMIVDKQVPVIMKPIEINFDNFSVKLNGVPKKISVNPDTNAIEIDL